VACKSARGRRNRKNNKTKIAEAVKRYQSENKQMIADYQRNYRKENKAKLAAENRKYYQENKAKIAKTREKYQNENKEFIAASVKRYAQANPNVLSAINGKRRAAKIQRTVPWADDDKVKELYKEAQRLAKETGIPHDVDHIIPLQGENVSGLHVENNLQVITASANRMKRNKFDPWIDG